MSQPVPRAPTTISTNHPPPPHPIVILSFRRAYAAGDVELSIAAHDKKLTGTSEENHTTDANDLVKSLIFGGLDGIITTFAIVAAVAGAGMSTNTIIVMGCANLIADGISMGLGDYISSKAEAEATIVEYNREKWELENYPEGEYKEVSTQEEKERQRTEREMRAAGRM